MGTFTITSSRLSTSYVYNDENIVVNGSFNKDMKTGNPGDINGSAYRTNADGSQGDYVGNFNGYVRGDETIYSMSEMSRRDSLKVWDAIDEIERMINENEEGE